MKAVSQRFLMIYSGVLTVTFALSVLYGFVQKPRAMTIDQLDVQRINVREPDGTLRLVISSADKSPGIIIRGKEHPHPSRKDAGMIFYNDEGTENGGLIFGGETRKDGTRRTNGHLSFDAYEQDQTMALETDQNGPDRYTKLLFRDYPDYSILEELRLMDAIKDLPPDTQQARMQAFFDQKGGPTTRMMLGRGTDGSVQLALNDTHGHPRLVMKVDPDGAPSIQMLDSAGKVASELVPKQ